MREILFRGKRVDDDKWVELNLTPFLSEVLEIKSHYDEESLIDMSTLCQFTGLTDNHGKKIFEGDILKCVGNKRISKGVLMDFEEVTHISVVEWWNSYCNCGYRVKNQNGKTMMIKQSSLIGMKAEIIGNIFDNPELIKEW